MNPSPRPSRLLVLSQVYIPDPASVGQHMADAAAEMARRGWEVIVLTSRRGYDDASQIYPASETIDGVQIRRLPLSSFGKKNVLLRILAAILFMLQVTVRGLFTPRLTCILVSTSPPMCLVAALIINLIRGTPIKFWVMDLNPDQLIALEKIGPRSMPARIMDFFNRMILRRSKDVVALDRFMGERLLQKADIKKTLHISPPWPHEEHLELVPHESNSFRQKHNLGGKFVFMYSGNHGIALPLETFLKAAVQFKDDPSIVFMFIGGGVRKKEVEQTIREHGMTNLISLPYQPIDQLRYSLSAADVHLVSMADSMVGVIHPCKIYGVMAVARPIMLLGPHPSHLSELIDQNYIGWTCAHGDVEGVVKTINQIRALPREELIAMGLRGREVINDQLSMKQLCGAFCDILCK